MRQIEHAVNFGRTRAGTEPTKDSTIVLGSSPAAEPQLAQQTRQAAAAAKSTERPSEIFLDERPGQASLATPAPALVVKARVAKRRGAVLWGAVALAVVAGAIVAFKFIGGDRQASQVELRLVSSPFGASIHLEGLAAPTTP